MECHLRDWIYLLRPWFHHNYSIVIFGALVFSPQVSWDIVIDLVIHYITFTLCTYGGIYVMNAISDAHLDAQHPEKRLRPIPAGRVSIQAAQYAVAILWTMGFGLSALWAGATVFWPVYAAFIAINIAYSFGGLRRSSGRMLIGCTSPLRLYLGAVIGGTNPPVMTYVIVFAFMMSVQSLKFRVEANGSAAFDSRVKGAPLELCMSLFIIALIATIPSIHQPEIALWMVLSALSFSLFVIGPIVDPRAAIMFGVRLHQQPKPSFRLRIARSLLAVGDYAGLSKFVVFSALSLLNQFLMGLEETLFPALLAPESDNMHFILGHQRSGTTALHEAVLRHDRTIGCTVFDIWCPSLVMKVLAMPLKPVLDVLSRQHDSLNHSIKIDEPSEEHVFCLHQCRDHALFMLFPALMRHPDAKALLQEALAFAEPELDLMHRCMQRVLVAARLVSGRQDLVYVARPLSMTKDVERLQQRFRGARMAVCVRDVQAVVPSWVQMYAVTANDTSLDDPAFQAFMRTSYTAYSQPTFHTALKLVGPGRSAGTVAAMFDEWKAQPQKVLQRVLGHLLDSEVAEHDVAPLIHTAAVAHKNSPLCRKIVAVDPQLVARCHHLAAANAAPG